MIEVKMMKVPVQTKLPVINADEVQVIDRIERCGVVDALLFDGCLGLFAIAFDFEGLVFSEGSMWAAAHAINAFYSDGVSAMGDWLAHVNLIGDCTGENHE